MEVRKNRKRSRTMILSTKIAQRKLIEPATNEFYKKPTLDKNVSMEILWEEFGPIVLKILSFENRKKMGT